MGRLFAHGLYVPWSVCLLMDFTCHGASVCPWTLPCHGAFVCSWTLPCHGAFVCSWTLRAMERLFAHGLYFAMERLSAHGLYFAMEREVTYDELAWRATRMAFTIPYGGRLRLSLLPLPPTRHPVRPPTQRREDQDTGNSGRSTKYDCVLGSQHECVARRH